MTTLNIVAACFVIFAVAIIIFISIYKLSKNNNAQPITLESFVDMYGDVIIDVLKDSVKILQINIENFDSKESYEMCIISTAIESIKENGSNFGVDGSLINLFDTVALTEAIHAIFSNNIIDIFSVLSAQSITKDAKLYEEEVVLALGEAK